MMVQACSSWRPDDPLRKLRERREDDPVAGNSVLLSRDYRIGGNQWQNVGDGPQRTSASSSPWRRRHRRDRSLASWGGQKVPCDKKQWHWEHRSTPRSADGGNFPTYNSRSGSIRCRTVPIPRGQPADRDRPAGGVAARTDRSPTLGPVAPNQSERTYFLCNAMSACTGSLFA